MWTDQLQGTLNSKKHGDSAFHAEEFSKAIDFYTQVSQLEMLKLIFNLT
jgi:BR-signaling kinase